MRANTATLTPTYLPTVHEGWLRAARFVRNVLLFAVAPFVGLAYAVAFPFVGLAVAVWMATRKEPAAR